VACADALRELGYEFTMVATDNPDALKGLVDELQKLSPRNSRARLAWEIYLVCRRVEALDRIQDRANRIRHRAVRRSRLDRAVVRAKNEIARARGWSGILLASRRAKKILDEVELRPARKRPVRVGIAGEFYTVVDAHTNFHVEQILGDLGVEVHRGVWIGQWLNDRIRYRPLRRHDRKRAKRVARPYLEFSPGGECVVTLARVIDWHRAGLDGVVHLLPFTCMPEMIAASILPAVTRDHPIPVLRVIIDEHTDGTGLRTRLEAFVDTLVQRRRA
jgi:predicted nucleotide-binding protein (sugar kinase/HSP70/actin superfamily)